MKSIFYVGLVLAHVLGLPIQAKADLNEAVVILRVRGCDYFLADGSRGIFLLERYGGFDPSRGDTLVGDISSYGFQDVYYTKAGRKGRVHVEDYLLSCTRAAEKLADKCD